ncbi:MAG: L-seryl-tRNA(Sec) selenium transferase [Deltaproteobacteria bacterium]|nr:L-seryl-tRNA(Sec) selenium transferase [Deltaproteobacteria bacterium]
MSREAALRSLPSVDAVLTGAAAAGLLARYRRAAVTEAIRVHLEQLRSAVLAESAAVPAVADIVVAVGTQLRASEQLPLPRVINATGVVVHTNLGRALLAEPALAALAEAARHPVALEYDLDRGERGERDEVVEADLCALTGAEAATVVNNNAAAVLLALNTLAEQREVIVSRGELIEIGGSFRIPAVMAKSGVRLREVGTTNRTHARDYSEAVGPQTALLLKVHSSNYRIVGFTAEVSLAELVAIGREHQLPVLEDLGSGALVDFSQWGLPKEPVVAERIRHGADAVTFSGDKLLGGPQCGLIVGRRVLIERMRKNPLKRALRCDKLTLAALAATLRLYRYDADLAGSLPTLRWLSRPLAEIAAVAGEACALLQAALGAEYRIEVLDAQSQIGSGSVPTRTLATKAVAITHPAIGAQQLAERFRRANPPIIGRVHDGRFLLDARCIAAAAELVPRT